MLSLQPSSTLILRDFPLTTYQLIFTKPITKFAYLVESLGRFLSSPRLSVSAACSSRGAGHPRSLGLPHPYLPPATSAGNLHLIPALAPWCRPFFWLSLFFGVLPPSPATICRLSQCVVVFSQLTVVTPVFSRHVRSIISGLPYSPRGYAPVESVPPASGQCRKEHPQLPCPGVFPTTGSSEAALTPLSHHAYLFLSLLRRGAHRRIAWPPTARDADDIPLSPAHAFPAGTRDLPVVHSPFSPRPPGHIPEPHFAAHRDVLALSLLGHRREHARFSFSQWPTSPVACWSERLPFPTSSCVDGVQGVLHASLPHHRPLR